MRWLARENGFVHVCGLRGHSLGAPENTLAAFRATRDMGGTTAEIDVVLCRDGEIVVLHDLTIDRTTNGHGLAASLDLAAIQGLDAGSWFAQTFAEERIPTFKEAIELGIELDLGFVVEIKERYRVRELMIRLKQHLLDSGCLDRLTVTSFDHTLLRDLKAAIPGVRTEGITYARHADPVGVARSANLDSLSIQHHRFHPDDARALHAAGIAIRCHLPEPDELFRLREFGIDFEAELGPWLEEGLIDSLSGADVAFLRALVDRHPIYV